MYPQLSPVPCHPIAKPIAEKKGFQYDGFMKPTREELHGIWQHLVYEIQMLNETGRVLSTFRADESNDRDRVVQNALVESFALHARTIISLLYYGKQKDDDVVAGDFLDDPVAWENRRPAMTDLLKTVHRRVAKEVAHLTYARVEITDEERKWPFVQVAIDIDRVLKEFIALLPPDFPKPPTSASLQTHTTATTDTSSPVSVVHAEMPNRVVTEVASKGLPGSDPPP